MTTLSPTSKLAVIDSTPTWGLETLWKMDWKRFQELVSLILARSGFASEVAWIRPDGTTVMSVCSRSKRGQSGEALVQCAGWTHYEVSATSLLEFYKSVVNEGAARGIYVTPGTFDANAQIFARSKNLELIDGAELLRTIGRMSYDEQQMYRRMALVGPWEVPSCPSCNHKLELHENAFPSGQDQRKLMDLTMKVDQQVNDQVYCRHLFVKPGVDVLFLNGVEAETMEIAGRVMGDLVCRGKLTVTAGACVSGLVAARSIRLDPGGLLEAEARIYNEAEIRSVRPQPKQRLWKCSQPRCRGSLPERA
jgi:Restriction endonuclease/Polymer-forming cytoskeletal